MKVQLIVVQGKPEGKVIPLNGPNFKIGRGEACHLRPNSELISREHAEVSIGADSVSVRDLGSRNGTLVNNKLLSGPQVVKNGDLIQVGPLTFAVSILGASTPAAQAVPGKGASLDGISGDEIDAWLVGDENHPAPEHSGQLYKGDTMTFEAFKAPTKSTPPAVKPQEPPKPEDEEEANEEDEPEELEMEAEEPEEPEAEEEEQPVEELIDESNPFYVAKKKATEPPSSAASSKDSSEAANDILKRMMDRRRSSR